MTSAVSHYHFEPLRAVRFVVTDSGGIQEEAPAFGTPVVVVRRMTERPEAVEAGNTRLVGPDPEAIVALGERWRRASRPTRPRRPRAG